MKLEDDEKEKNHGEEKLSPPAYTLSPARSKAKPSTFSLFSLSPADLFDILSLSLSLVLVVRYKEGGICLYIYTRRVD